MTRLQTFSIDTDGIAGNLRLVLIADARSNRGLTRPAGSFCGSMQFSPRPLTVAEVLPPTLRSGSYLGDENPVTPWPLQQRTAHTPQMLRTHPTSSLYLQQPTPSYPPGRTFAEYGEETPFTRTPQGHSRNEATRNPGNDVLYAHNLASQSVPARTGVGASSSTLLKAAAPFAMATPSGVNWGLTGLSEAYPAATMVPGEALGSSAPPFANHSTSTWLPAPTPASQTDLRAQPPAALTSTLVSRMEALRAQLLKVSSTLSGVQERASHLSTSMGQRSHTLMQPHGGGFGANPPPAPPASAPAGPTLSHHTWQPQQPAPHALQQQTYPYQQQSYPYKQQAYQQQAYQQQQPQPQLHSSSPAGGDGRPAAWNAEADFRAVSPPGGVQPGGFTAGRSPYSADLPYGGDAVSDGALGTKVYLVSVSRAVESVPAQPASPASAVVTAAPPPSLYSASYSPYATPSHLSMTLTATPPGVSPVQSGGGAGGGYVADPGSTGGFHSPQHYIPDQHPYASSPPAMPAAAGLAPTGPYPQPQQQPSQQQQQRLSPSSSTASSTAAVMAVAAAAAAAAEVTETAVSTGLPPWTDTGAATGAGSQAPVGPGSGVSPSPSPPPPSRHHHPFELGSLTAQTQRVCLPPPELIVLDELDTNNGTVSNDTNGNANSRSGVGVGVSVSRKRSVDGDVAPRVLQEPSAVATVVTVVPDVGDQPTKTAHAVGDDGGKAVLSAANADATFDAAASDTPAESAGSSVTLPRPEPASPPAGPLPAVASASASGIAKSTYSSAFVRQLGSPVLQELLQGGGHGQFSGVGERLAVPEDGSAPAVTPVSYASTELPYGSSGTMWGGISSASSADAARVHPYPWSGGAASATSGGGVGGTTLLTSMFTPPSSGAHWRRNGGTAAGDDGECRSSGGGGGSSWYGTGGRGDGTARSFDALSVASSLDAARVHPYPPWSSVEAATASAVLAVADAEAAAALSYHLQAADGSLELMAAVPSLSPPPAAPHGGAADGDTDAVLKGGAIAGATGTADEGRRSPAGAVSGLPGGSWLLLSPTVVVREASGLPGGGAGARGSGTTVCDGREVEEGLAVAEAVGGEGGEPKAADWTSSRPEAVSAAAEAAAAAAAAESSPSAPGGGGGGGGRDADEPSDLSDSTATTPRADLSFVFHAASGFAAAHGGGGRDDGEDGVVQGDADADEEEEEEYGAAVVPGEEGQSLAGVVADRARRSADGQGGVLPSASAVAAAAAKEWPVRKLVLSDDMDDDARTGSSAVRASYDDEIMQTPTDAPWRLPHFHHRYGGGGGGAAAPGSAGDVSDVDSDTGRGGGSGRSQDGSRRALRAESATAAAAAAAAARGRRGSAGGGEYYDGYSEEEGEEGGGLRESIGAASLREVVAARRQQQQQREEHRKEQHRQQEQRQEAAASRHDGAAADSFSFPSAELAASGSASNAASAAAAAAAAALRSVVLAGAVIAGGGGGGGTGSNRSSTSGVGSPRVSGTFESGCVWASGSDPSPGAASTPSVHSTNRIARPSRIVVPSSPRSSISGWSQPSPVPSPYTYGVVGVRTPSSGGAATFSLRKHLDLTVSSCLFAESEDEEGDAEVESGDEAESRPQVH